MLASLPNLISNSFPLAIMFSSSRKYAGSAPTAQPLNCGAATLTSSKTGASPLFGPPCGQGTSVKRQRLLRYAVAILCHQASTKSSSWASTACTCAAASVVHVSGNVQDVSDDPSPALSELAFA